MFVPKKTHRFGPTSVVVVDKHAGTFKELHTASITRNEKELEDLCKQGRARIVKKTFRISKGALETRPISHFTEKRIEAAP